MLPLRTLTEKSQMKFGKYSDMKVGSVMIMPLGTTYLRWVYYNCSLVSFCDDVLDFIGVYQDIRIGKPGNNPEIFKKVFISRLNINDKKGTEGIVAKRGRKKRAKSNMMNVKHRDRIKFSKSSMQSRNQGH